MNKNTSTVKTTHTPGPWTAVAWAKVQDARGNCVAKTHDARWTSISLDEGAANARLIAAAPELLAALKTVLRDGCGGWDEMVRAAIAKAEGK